MLKTLAIRGYRSLRELTVSLQQLNVVTGANGSGKSSLYRALRLLAQTASGDLIASLAREGGLDSTLWAGPEKISRDMRAGRAPIQGTRRSEPVHLSLGFAAEQFSYAVDLGKPIPGESAFDQDPHIKRECIWAGPVFRKASLLVERRGPLIRATDETGAWRDLPQGLPSFESMLSEFVDPRSAPEMTVVREDIRSWRFYDHLRTDAEAPARQAQVGTHTPVLDNAGAGLAAALQTIREIGDAAALDETIADAFPGSRVLIEISDGRFETAMRQKGLLRPLRAAELSDGTLRYLLLTAALLTPRPPSLMVLNEPETSLHPDLVAPLGRLIARAARRSQMIVVTHHPSLVEDLCEAGGAPIHLIKDFGETRIEGQGLLDRPAWEWPPR